MTACDAKTPRAPVEPPLMLTVTTYGLATWARSSSSPRPHLGDAKLQALPVLRTAVPRE